MGIFESVAHLVTEGYSLYLRGKAAMPGGTLEENLEQNNTATKAALVNVLEEYASGRIKGSTAIGETAGQLLGNRAVKYMEEKGYNPIIANLTGWAASYIGGKIVGGIAEKLIDKDDSTDNATRTLEANGRIPTSGEAAGKDPGLLAHIREMLGGGSERTPYVQGAARTATRGTAVV